MKEYILSNQEAQEIDDYTMGELGVSGADLMRKAGNYVALKAKKTLTQIPGSRIDIFCGTGNNGGDGFVAGEKLIEWGAHVHLWVVGKDEDIEGEALHYYQQTTDNQPIEVSFLLNQKSLQEIDNLHGSDLIIDALLGTGLKGEVRGIYTDIIKKINDNERPVISVDIPSGINGNTGKKGGIAVEADETVTMEFLKRGLLYNDGPTYCGEVVIADLQYPDESYEILDNKVWLFHQEHIPEKLPAIPFDTYKHRRGKILSFVGSEGMSGAGILVSKAALRTGSGLVVNAVPESINYVFENQVTEALSFPLPESQNKTLCKESFEASQEKIDWSNVIVFGPGVGEFEEVLEFGKELIKETNQQFVIDADGLKVFKDDLALLHKLDNPVLTPHPGELAYITGESVSEVKDDIIEFGNDFVEEYNCTLVIKGPHTLTISPHDAAVNATGNPGLATGGTGDVLTGIIASLIGQNLSPFDAAATAVSIHGTAADKAVKDLGFRGLIAQDLLKYIPKVLQQYDEIKN